MARSTEREGNITIIEPGEFENDYTEPVKTEADIALEDFLDKARAIGATAKLTIHKLSNGTNSSETFCSSFPVDKYDYFELLDVIQRTWGAGDYRLYCTVKGRKGVLQNQFVSVGDAPGKVGSGQSHATNNSDVLSQVIKMMQENNDRLVAALKPKEDTGEARQKMLQEMLIMKQLFGGETKNAGGMGEIIGLIKGLKEIGVPIGLAGEVAESDAGFTGIIEKFIPLATAIASRPPAPVQQVQRVNRPPQRPAQLGAPQPVQQPQPKQEPKKMSPEEKALHQGISMLVMGAKTQADPGDYAEMVLNNVQEDVLEAMFTDPQAIDNLAKINPEVMTYRAWFEDLGEHIKACLGLPSKFADLYSDAEADNLEENTPTDSVDAPASDLHNAGNTER